MKILNNIQSIRWERNISLRELSKLSGVSHTTISKIENGLISPSQLTMIKISMSLNLEVGEVFNLNYNDIDLSKL